MSDLLLVWEMVPEATTLYVIPEGSDMAEMAVASAGKYINGDDLPDDHAIFKLSERLEDYPHLPDGGMAEGPFSKVIVCGFFM